MPHRSSEAGRPIRQPARNTGAESGPVPAAQTRGTCRTLKRAAEPPWTCPPRESRPSQVVRTTGSYQAPARRQPACSVAPPLRLLPHTPSPPRPCPAPRPDRCRRRTCDSATRADYLPDGPGMPTGDIPGASRPSRLRSAASLLLPSKSCAIRDFTALPLELARRQSAAERGTAPSGRF